MFHEIVSIWIVFFPSSSGLFAFMDGIFHQDRSGILQLSKAVLLQNRTPLRLPLK